MQYIARIKLACVPARACLREQYAFVWHWVKNRQNKWLRKICLVTILSWTKKIKKVSVAYDRNSLSDRASSNDVATNDVNGRIGNKTWCKCECCAPMETSVEDVCCLEIPEICQPRFSSTLCLYVYRSDSNFVQLCFKRENFCYLNSTQCWSLANQNKSLWLSFPVIIFCLYKRCFFGFFCENVFSREHSIRFRGLLLLKSNILSSESPEVIHGCSRTF